MVEELYLLKDVDFEWVETEYDDLKQWLIKGVWYFDKKYSELIYRPIGIAPVISSSEDLLTEKKKKRKKKKKIYPLKKIYLVMVLILMMMV